MQVHFRPGKSFHLWCAIRHGKQLPLYRFKLAPACQQNKIKIKAETIALSEKLNAEKDFALIRYVSPDVYLEEMIVTNV